MSEFTLFRPRLSTGPAFDDAAGIIKELPQIRVIDSFNSESGAGGMLIDTDDATMETLKQKLDGWTIAPKVEYGHASP